jgi:hypothetical protein
MSDMFKAIPAVEGVRKICLTEGEQFDRSLAPKESA